jgi:hypothetical protein
MNLSFRYAKEDVFWLGRAALRDEKGGEYSLASTADSPPTLVRLALSPLLASQLPNGSWTHLRSARQVGKCRVPQHRQRAELVLAARTHQLSCGVHQQPSRKSRRVLWVLPPCGSARVGAKFRDENNSGVARSRRVVYLLGPTRRPDQHPTAVGVGSTQPERRLPRTARKAMELALSPG